MIIELLQDMPSPNTPGKTWRKGQLVDVSDDYGNTLIESGEGKKWVPPPPEPPETRKSEPPHRRKK